MARQRRAWGLAVLLLTATAAAAQPGPVLSGSAGLAGTGRPGRWAPVRLVITAGAEPVDGRVIAEWGDAVVERAIAVAPRSPRAIELYIRTAEPGPSITVRLETATGSITQKLPIRIADPDDLLIVCAGGAADADCSLHASPEDAPSSWRGYDAGDDLRTGSATHALSHEQEDALALAVKLRTAEAAGGLSTATGMLSPPQLPSARTTPPLALYVAGLALAAALAHVLSSRWFVRYGAVAVVVAGGAVVSAQLGKSAPVAIAHASIVHEFDGVRSTRVIARAIAVAPTDGPVTLRADVTGVIDARRRGGRDAAVPLDVDGRPVLTAHSGLGEGWALFIDADGHEPVLSVTSSMGVMRLTNISTTTLTNCELPDGFTPRTVPALAAGATFEVRGSIDGPGRSVTCTHASSPIAFTDRDRSVAVEGTTVAVHHLSADNGR